MDSHCGPSARGHITSPHAPGETVRLEFSGAPEIAATGLRLHYQGLDGVVRTTDVHFDVPPTSSELRNLDGQTADPSDGLPMPGDDDSLAALHLVE